MRLKRFYIFISVFGLLIITGIFFAVHAFSSMFEAENGTLSGTVSIGSDSTASGGKYIIFNPTSTTPSPTGNISYQPAAPYYATFYYMWFKNPATDGAGQWGIWGDGNNPPTTWFSHYLPDPNTVSFDPTNELYSANDYNNFKWQISKMEEAHLTVAIGSWWGQGDRSDVAFNNIINSFMAKPDNPYPNLRWGIYYECEGNVCNGTSDPSVTQIVSDLNYIKTKYANSPYMLKINGKPVVFVYSDPNDVPGTMTQRWHDANVQAGNAFYIVLKVFPGYATDPNQPDSWHQYAPAVRSDSQGSYSFMVSPGFWKDDGSAVRLVRDPAAFTTAVQTMVASNAKWKLVETWNEWGEGTGVEPAEQTMIDSTGKEVLDPNGTQFGNTYINILNSNLPAISTGTSSTTTPVSTTSSNPTPTSTTTSNTDPVIAAAGDIACGVGSTGASCKQSATATLIAAVNPSAVLPLGDNQYEEGLLSDWQNFYDLSWGKFKNITHPVVGNHEYLTTGAAGYFDYFNGVGNQNGAAGNRNQGYYAYNLGTWRLYALNSNCSEAGGCGVGSPQETWLKNDLAANPHQCVLAYYHHPLYTSGTRALSSVKPLYQDLYNAHAEIILNGHEHNYERFAPQDANGVANANGIVEFVVGTGGRNFTPLGTPIANSVVGNDNTFGILKLVLHQASYSFNFLPIAGSTFTDSGNANCH